MESKRIWEIDLLRAIAIILMIIFHFVYDLNEFLGIDINYRSGFWYWEGKISALIFIFVSGISSGFSKHSFKRGLKVLGYGMIVTAVTYVALGDMYIRFGILHLLGTCMIIFPVLKAMNNWLLLGISAVIFYISPVVSSAKASNALLLPLGLKYPGLRAADYYPLIPYLAVFILGVISYKLYYHKKKSLFNFTLYNETISVISQKSLLIYLIHQPLLLAGIYLYSLT
ncbi:DUF1624 domain-containing protein [Alkalicella caledoniensis]|uniref:DUF1624 domain-containing protein n=1 Tax=Alkalicella caledoniensis TaxID=2731377 RepID=A0A7G9W9Y9_ALKCA|nr:heparan-alpha-glucosaminide N-acetyltransferase [Alkalicella caledoniensis]QNO15501.1 DUF1624 domain-containing protein [Alkalicella caledoniensis]